MNEKPVIKETDTTGNNLFPVFFKLENLHVLLVGAGNVGLEKINSILMNSPGTSVTVVAENILPAFAERIASFPNVKLIRRPYQADFLDDCDLVISAVNDLTLSAKIRADARQKGKLINAADKPELCDFYLSSIVKKGNLKLAISTNGKSPTIAKRLREIFEELLPEELDELLGNLQEIRNKLKGDFKFKVEKLNEITKALVE